MSKKASSGKGKAKKGPLNGPNRLEMKKKKATKVNPFERRFGREKHKVLNRRSGLGDLGVTSGSGSTTVSGRPGQARARAQMKRRQVLLPEYQKRHKSGSLVDRRLGENDPTMTAEAKAEVRFAAAERARQQSRKRKKSTLFQLADEDDGEMLTHRGRAIADIERFDDDPRSDDEQGHDEEEEDKILDAKFVGETHFGGFMSQTDLEFASGRANSRKEWIDQMIADSKKRKFERQRNLEEAETKTKELDSKWRGLLGVVRVHGQKSKEDKEPSSDSYDVVLRELGFEKGRKEAKDRLKTEEEVVKEEKEKLEKLEAERLKRMRGETEEAVEDEEDGDEEEEKEDEEEEDGEDEEEESEDEDDEGSDLEESDEEEEAKEAPKAKKVAKSAKVKEGQKAPKSSENNDLPYTFSVPETYDALESLFSGRPASDHAVIAQRMLKCNHPQLAEGNRDRLQRLFNFLLQHVHDCAVDFGAAEEGEGSESLESIQRLTPFLYDLAHFSQAAAAKAVLSVLQEKYEEFAKQPRLCPGTEVLVFLKIACLLFPTSDYRHPVVTPAVNFMSHVLSSIRVSGRAAVATGIYVCALMTESLRLSKRFCPELLNFLTGIVFVSLPKDKAEVVEFVPPFKVVGPESQLLGEDVAKGSEPSPLTLSDTKSEDDIDASFAASALAASLALLSDLAELWRDLPAVKEAFAPVTSFLKALLEKSGTKMHPSLKSKAESLLQRDFGAKRAVQAERKKPKILRQFEPEFDDSFDPLVKKRSTGGGKDEMGRMMHKLKRERKGAKKEIRQDAAFIAKLKAKEQREKDQERLRKTREILSGLGNQEGDYRKMQKKKRKMK